MGISGSPFRVRPEPLLRIAPLLLWMASCGSAEPDLVGRVIGGDASEGPALIQHYGCGSCHVVPGVRGANGLAGPPLTDFARRAFIAGNVANTPEHLVAWIRVPQAIEPGTAMPNMGVTDVEARHIAAYLYSNSR